MASHPIYQFYAELDDYKPTIWRRFQVTDDATVARLGYIVQVLFEMTASHLMAIELPHSENFRNYMRIKHPSEAHKYMVYEAKDEKYIRYEIPDDDMEPYSDPMNKIHWNTVTIGGDVPKDEIMRMIERSYDLVKPKGRKQKKQEE